MSGSVTMGGPEGEGAPVAVCAMACLVEAGRDGRLGEREEASLARHLVMCAACRTLARELDDVRGLLRRPAGAPLTQLEHQRGRLALLRAAALPPSPSIAARPRARRMSVAAAAVAALAAIAAPGLLRPRPVAVPVAQHLPPLARPPAASPGRDQERSYPPETTLRGSASARFERRSIDQLERVALTEGTLDLAVRKLDPGERFLVATDDAEVEVRGTVFQVEAHAGHVARVAVREGEVEVRHRHTVSIVAAGGEWQPPQDTTAVVEAPRPRARAPGAVASRPPLPRPESGGEASRSFGDAVDLLGRGDYAAARSRLDAFRSAHPADGRADLAAFLTIVSLQRAGRRTDAQEAARRYLELYPEGDRRADVARVVYGR